MIENLQRYSVRVTPQANLQRKYSALVEVREMLHGLPDGTEVQHSTPIADFIPMLIRLGVQGEIVGHIMARFEHLLPITVTADIDPEALQREGFQSV